MKIIIDGQDCVMGRLSTYIAKQALQGNEIVVVNSEKVFITGNKKNILEKYQIMRSKGKSQKMKGPIFPTLPGRILKRAVRGMLKYKEGRGKEAFEKIRCYKGVPAEYEKSEKTSREKLEKGKKGMTLAEISKLLRGGK